MVAVLIRRQTWKQMTEAQYQQLMLVCQRPSMFVRFGTFDEVCSYINGIHAATGCLIGFREWLIVKLETGNNLVWEALVLHEFKSGSVQDDEKVDRLGQIIDEFYKFTGPTVGATSGLMKVYLRYHGWLLNQGWYNSDRPEYIPPYEENDK